MIMKRIIVDYAKLNEDILALLVEKFPSGYKPSDIIIFRNAQNEVIECVEVRTDDTIYLVKVSKRLVAAMDDFDEDDNDDSDSEMDDNTDIPDDDSEDYD